MSLGMVAKSPASMQPEKDYCIVAAKAVTMAKTILIVEDNAYIRLGLCELFKGESDFEVCGEAENGKEAIAKPLSHLS